MWAWGVRRKAFSGLIVAAAAVTATLLLVV
jgi:hypothetical protein